MPVALTDYIKNLLESAPDQAARDRILETQRYIELKRSEDGKRQNQARERERSGTTQDAKKGDRQR